jgi:putative methyltransferase (TIGR04325 family)
VLFYLTSILPTVKTVFDFGGNVGNLFYCYSQHVAIPSETIWTIYDLPKVLDTGRQLALENLERQLRFTESLESAEGVDLLLASGSIHYFESALPELLRTVRHKPKHVIVNRTPLTDGKSVVAIQDAGPFLVACKLFNRQEVLDGFASLGYEVVDTWRVDELSVRIPCYPDLSVSAYSGMYLRLKGDSRCAAEQSNPPEPVQCEVVGELKGDAGTAIAFT